MGGLAPFHWLIIFVVWGLPIILGIWAAKRKNYSPHWMWLGVYPMLGWLACIVLILLPAKDRCPNCGGFVTVNFRICPYCHVGLDRPSSRASSPTQPPSP